MTIWSIRVATVVQIVFGFASAFFWFRGAGLPWRRGADLNRPSRILRRWYIVWGDPQTKEAANAAAAAFAGVAMVDQALIAILGWQ